MINIDLTDLTPPPQRGAPKAPARPAPCAGLFGWRKGDAAPGHETKDSGRR